MIRASARLAVSGALALTSLAGIAQPAAARPDIVRAVAWEAPVAGSVSSLEIRVDTRRRERLHVVVSDADGRRLASAVAMVGGAGWRRVGLRAFGVAAARRYWVAVDAAPGTLRLVRGAAACRASARRTPARWEGARAARACPTIRVTVTAAPPARPGPAAPAPELPLAQAVPSPSPSPSPEPSPSPTPTPTATPTPTPTATPTPPATLPSPAQAVVSSAVTTPLIRFGRQYGDGLTNDAWNTGASVVLATAAFAGNTSADARLLAQLRDLLSGGKEPVANGGYATQHERFGTGMLVIARHVPRIWQALSASERARADLVMEGALVGAAFTTSDSNPFVVAGTQQYTLDADSNVHRDWSPNFREGMVGMALVSAAYFGPDEAARRLQAFRHADFLAAIRAAGLTNLATTFDWRAAHPTSKAPTPAQIEQAVRGWRYYGTSITEPMRLYRTLTENTFNSRVSCGLDGGAGIATPDGMAGIIATGCSGLPNKNALGELQEFDSIDGGGARSSAYYAYDGGKVNLVNQLALVAGGLWRAGGDADAALARIRIGMIDLWYKLDRGYRGYAKGASQWVPGAVDDPFVYRSDNTYYGFAFNRSLWQDVLRPYHGL